MNSVIGDGKNATVLIAGDLTGKRTLFEAGARDSSSSSSLPNSSQIALCTDYLFERSEEVPNFRNNNITAKQHRISVSWYCLDITRSEGIIDMLKTASASTRNEEPGIDPSLICRDNGFGDGVNVSGLWEIEVNSGSDVDDIILKVSRRVQGWVRGRWGVVGVTQNEYIF